MWALFKDKNEINEKNIIGFASFIVMVLFAIADLTTSFLYVDAALEINEVVYLRKSKNKVRFTIFDLSVVEKFAKQQLCLTK